MQKSRRKSRKPTVKALGGTNRRVLRQCRAKRSDGLLWRRGAGRRHTAASRIASIDLVIQDELHLISGPLGTIAGLYESAFDLLASRKINGEWCGPKIVASTATVRRAETQIRNLFGRERTAIFPPPGVSRDDSFFARIDKDTPSRLYLGVASPGRGPKLVFLRALQTLLSGAATLSSGGPNDPADPYLTALCYFNALRECALRGMA
jgi:hypothetical protein